MAHKESTLLTIIVVVIIIFVILWVIWNVILAGSTRSLGLPDPVANIEEDCSVPGEVTISWDKSANAAKYRIYVNKCDKDKKKKPCDKKKKRHHKKGPRHHVAGGHEEEEEEGCHKHKGESCDCPGKPCKGCVSQTDYCELFETSHNSITIETCEPCLCFLIIPYNKLGQTGPACRSSVRFAEVNCKSPIQAWVIENSCKCLKIGFKCGKCCETVKVFVNNHQVEEVECCAEEVTIPAIGDHDKVSLECCGCCGCGEKTHIPCEKKHHEHGCGCKDRHHEHHNDCGCDECHHKRRRHHQHDDNCGCEECHSPRRNHSSLPVKNRIPHMENIQRRFSNIRK